MLNLETSSILPFLWDFYHELHVNPSFASITVHEEVVELVNGVLLLEHDEVLLAATRSFHLIFEYFFCRNRPGIRVFESLLDSQRESALFVAPGESDLFILRVVSLRFLSAQHKSANNGSHRSIMTDWRRQTGRQAFFFRVSSSARVKERAADGDVIAVEVIREPLLARGLLGVFDISLCWSGPWAHNLWEARSRPGCQGPQRKYAGYLSTTLRKLKVSGSRNSRVIREMMRKEKKWREKSKRSEATLRVRMNMKMTMGWTETQTWATVCVHLNKEDSQRTMTLTDNREERLRKRRIYNAWRLMHALASTTSTLTLTCSPSVSSHFTHCWVLHCASCRQF